MKEIIKRLDEIDAKLKEYDGKGDGETYVILRNRLRSTRDGIVFALKSLGLKVVHGFYGWFVKCDGKDEED